MKYRRKSYTIEANQWFKETNNGEVYLFERPFKIGDRVFVGKLVSDTFNLISDGDWIIKDENGSTYTCKDDSFKDKYEEIG